MCMALFFSFLLSLAVARAQGRANAAKEYRLRGSVHMINKDTSTITIQRGNIQRQISHNADTRVAYRNATARWMT